MRNFRVLSVWSYVVNTQLVMWFTDEMTVLTLGQTSCLVLLKRHFSLVVEPLFSSGRGSTAS